MENAISIEGVEVFRTGDYGDQGRFTTADLDAIAADYDPAKVHDAPVVLGHPSDDKPAFGWVKRLRRAGETLLADVDVVAELASWIKRGLYKKRSVAIYRDFKGTGKPYLKHLGFLGAVPPEVKGLADVKLSEGDAAGVATFYEFANSEKSETNGGDTMPDDIMFTEAQAATLTTAAVVKRENELTAIFKEADGKREAEIAALKKENAALADQVATFKERTAQGEIALFVEKLISDGKATPAQKPAIVAALERAAKTGDAELFSAVKGGFEAAGKVVEFKETGTGAQGDPKPGDAPTTFSMVDGKAK